MDGGYALRGPDVRVARPADIPHLAWAVAGARRARERFHIIADRLRNGSWSERSAEEWRAWLRVHRKEHGWYISEIVERMS